MTRIAPEVSGILPCRPPITCNWRPWSPPAAASWPTSLGGAFTGAFPRSWRKVFNNCCAKVRDLFGKAMRSICSMIKSTTSTCLEGGPWKVANTRLQHERINLYYTSVCSIFLIIHSRQVSLPSRFLLPRLLRRLRALGRCRCRRLGAPFPQLFGQFLLLETLGRHVSRLLQRRAIAEDQRNATPQLCVRA